MIMDLKQCFQKNQEVLTKETDGELYLVDPYRRVFMQLNQVGLEIWQMFDGKRPLSEIIEILEEKFEADEKILRRDVLDFVSGLKQRELVF